MPVEAYDRFAFQGGAMLFETRRLAPPDPAVLDPLSYGRQAHPVQAGDGRQPGLCKARAGRACCVAIGAAA